MTSSGLMVKIFGQKIRRDTGQSNKISKFRNISGHRP